MDSNPICHPSPAYKMKCSLLDYVHFGWSARLVDGLKPHPPPLSSQNSEMLIFVLHSTSDVGQTGQWIWTSSTTPLQPKNKMLIFWLYSTSDDQLGWSMDLNPICQPSPANKMKYYFLDYVQLLMLARLVNGLKPHPSPLSSQRNEILILWSCSTSHDQLDWSVDSNPIHCSSPAKTVKCSFLYYIQHLMLAKLVNGLEPHPPPLSSQKNEMLIFWSCSTSADQLGWSMDLNPICQPSPPKKMKCSFLDYVQLLMIGQVVNGLKLPLPALSSQKQWNATFWITFKFWWSAGLVNGLKPHPPPLSSQNSEMLIFVLHSTSDVGQTGQWTWTSSTTPLQPKIWNAHFWVTFNFWWLVGLFDELKPHLPSLSSLKNEMLIF